MVAILDSCVSPRSISVQAEMEDALPIVIIPPDVSELLFNNDENTWLALISTGN